MVPFQSSVFVDVFVQDGSFAKFSGRSTSEPLTNWIPAASHKTVKKRKICTRTEVSEKYSVTFDLLVSLGF